MRQYLRLSYAHPPWLESPTLRILPLSIPRHAGKTKQDHSDHWKANNPCLKTCNKDMSERRASETNLDFRKSGQTKLRSAKSSSPSLEISVSGTVTMKGIRKGKSAL